MFSQNKINDLLKIEFPLIMAPMFLVSNREMMLAAMKSGIAGAFPSLNFRKAGELAVLLDELNAFRKEMECNGTFGVNLIVQKTNPFYDVHLRVCVEKKVPFYITSLGSPAEVIEEAHAYGAKVFCDVTNLEHAQKCFDLNCDGFIAVGQGAGGHAGPFPLNLLVPALAAKFPGVPIIAAGGIANGESMLAAMMLGASAVSVGTRFIASTEATVSEEYKNAIVSSGMKDIVMTTKLSGTPCNIINTNYAKKIGYKQNWLERLLSNNKTTKKYFKALVQMRGMKKLERAIQPATYNTLWCAGQSVEMIHDILPCEEIVERMKREVVEAYEKVTEKFREK